MKALVIQIDVLLIKHKNILYLIKIEYKNQTF